MNDKDSRKIFESYTISRARLNEDVGTWTPLGQAMLARMRANAASGGGGGDPGYNHTGGMGPDLEPPDPAAATDAKVMAMARQHLGIQIERNPDGEWLKIGDKSAGEGDQPLSDEELVQVNQIEKQVG